MSSNLGTLTLDLVAKTGGFTGPLDKAGRDTQRLAKSLNTLAADGTASVDRLQRSFNTLNIKSGLQIDAEKTKIIAAFEAIKNSGVASAKEIERAQAAMKSRLGEVDGNLKSTTSLFSSLGAVASGAFAGVGVAAMVSQLHTAGMSAERFRNSFEAATGSVSKGTAEYGFARSEAQRLGLNLESTADAYLKLTAAAKGTALEGENTRGIFSAVSGASRALGLTSEQSSGALLAISQMMSKGTVQAEELRGQLGERLPGAFQIAARAMGVSTAELGKMLEGGKVIAEDFLPKFAAELEKTFPPGAKAMAGMTAETERFKTAWYELKTTVMESGGETLFTAIIRQISGATTAASDYGKMLDKIGAKSLAVSAASAVPGGAAVGVSTATAARLFGIFKPSSKPGITTRADAALMGIGQPSDSGYSGNLAMFSGVRNPADITANFGANLNRDSSFDPTKEEKKAASAAESKAKAEARAAAAAVKAIDDQVKALQTQAATVGMTTDAIKLKELADKGATPAQLALAAAALKTSTAFKDLTEETKLGDDAWERSAKEAQAAYVESLKKQVDMVASLQTEEEKLTDHTKDRLAVMESMTGLSSEDKSGMISKIIGSGFMEMPKSKLSSDTQSEMDKIDAAMEEQNDWYETQLEMLEDYRESKAELAAQWDEEELKLKKAHEDELARIEQARQAVQLAGAQAMFGGLSSIAKQFFGEQSALYKVAFATEKAFAIAKILVNAPSSYSKAYDAVVGIPYIGPAMAPIAGGVAVAAQMAQAVAVGSVNYAGQAHDGIMSVPNSGTWNLEKGERVTTAETSAKLDQTLDNVSKQSKSSGDAPIINMYEDKSKAGTVESRQQDDRRIIDIFVSDLMGDGRAQKAMSRKFGLQTVGA